MTNATNDSPRPMCLTSASGLSIEVNHNGSLRRMRHADVMLNLFPGNEVEGGPANLYLRRHGAGVGGDVGAAGGVEIAPLLGPASPGTVQLAGDTLVVAGEWRDVRFELALVLAAAEPAWFWHLRLENAGAAPLALDVVYAQDVGLAPDGAIRMNEYYVSQYLDHAPLAHPRHGHAVAVRQNLAVGGRIPWLVVGALGRGVSYATDALQVHGLATRAGAPPEGVEHGLPARRLQHEHAMVAIQDEPLALAPGAVAQRGFFGLLLPDHPEPTTDADVAAIDRACALAEATPPARATGASVKRGAASATKASGARARATLFATAPLVSGDDLSENELRALYPGEWRHVERDGASVLSFFTDAHRHVVLPAKERRSLRPHGQILRSGERLAPEEASLTTTVWMNGVFHSLVTQGHVNINRILSTVRSYLGLFRSHGLRVLVEQDGAWRLLGVPSAFDMTPGSARWTYQLGDKRIRIESAAATDRHELTLAIDVVSGAPCRFLLTHHVALGGDDGLAQVPPTVARDGDVVVLRTDPATDMGRRFPDGEVRIAVEPAGVLERVAGDEALFADGRSRGEPYVVLATTPTRGVRTRLISTLIAKDATTAAASKPASASGGARKHERERERERDTDPRAVEEAFWRDAAGALTLHAPAGEAGAALSRLHEILPWYAHDALIHFLAPRGLEQFSGGGWGTRDVCQGPVELLLGLGRVDALRALLIEVFAAQNPDGDWPQWWTFFARDRGIRADDQHGDIVFWPVLALAQYLLASDDAAILDLELPFFHPDGDARGERGTIEQHVERALGVVARRQVPGAHLAAYGHGDWNDALQPVDPRMRERLCSSWTVTLQYQTATTLAAALRQVGRDRLLGELDALAERTRADFQRLLLPDGTLAGFAWFHEDGRIEYLCHPSDTRTDMRYSLLPMIHAIINELLTPEQAARHVALLHEHLVAADGARLFDRPPVYRGGTQRTFQRAETSTYFGREIGLMYVHAHLRYAEAMARHGDADAFWLALRQAVPIGLRDVVPHARLRQANCYTSSSDPAVADRYEAQQRYADVVAGRIPVEGGWRVYSSGAGIAFRLIHEHLLGVKRGRSRLTIDPVLPRALDGLALDTTLAGRPIRIEYQVGARGCGVVGLALNGADLPFVREANPYRTGGAVIATADLEARLAATRNVLTVQLE